MTCPTTNPTPISEPYPTLMSYPNRFHPYNLHVALLLRITLTL